MPPTRLVSVELLLSRLDAVARSVCETGHALALIGLGSVGRELHRLDENSDLDFFVIAESGFKPRYLDRLDWLESLGPVAYCYRNTVDGYKLLYADGVFCEFAVFEPHELETIPFSPGRIVWKRDDVPETIAIPALQYVEVPKRSLEWVLGEIVTSIYSGMNRYLRGERLSAATLIQQVAVDRILELAELTAGALPKDRDRFAVERRAETRFPSLQGWLPLFSQGYDRTPESAVAILEYLSSNRDIDPSVIGVVRELIERATSRRN